MTQYNPGMQCGLVEYLCLNSSPCLEEKKRKKPRCSFCKARGPFRGAAGAGLRAEAREGEDLWAPAFRGLSGGGRSGPGPRQPSGREGEQGM